MRSAPKSCGSPSAGSNGTGSSLSSRIPCRYFSEKNRLYAAASPRAAISRSAFSSTLRALVHRIDSEPTSSRTSPASRRVSPACGRLPSPATGPTNRATRCSSSPNSASSLVFKAFCQAASSSSASRLAPRRRRFRKRPVPPIASASRASSKPSRKRLTDAARSAAAIAPSASASCVRTDANGLA